jgi:hypothetical protein
VSVKDERIDRLTPFEIDDSEDFASAEDDGPGRSRRDHLIKSSQRLISV